MPLDFTFYHLSISWKWAKSFTVYRGNEFVLAIDQVYSVTIQRAYQTDSKQDILHLEIHAIESEKRVFFIDHDTIQTNVREVDSSLSTISEVINWLLPQHYFQRQGDVGIYTCEEIPGEALSVDRALYQDYFLNALSKRHLLEPASHCQFYVFDDRYFIAVDEESFMVHPEHERVRLPKGNYEIVEARGKPLPEIIGLRKDEKPL